MKQNITSANTSINHLPKILRLIDNCLKTKTKREIFWNDNKIVLDYGGGKYDKLTDKLARRGIINLVYDPYNRSKDHNKLVKQILRIQKADMAICSNVLNVIENPKIITRILKDIKKHVRPSGSVFFTVYEGNRTSIGKETTKGWQANKPTKSYINQIEKVFDDVILIGKLIHAFGD